MELMKKDARRGQSGCRNSVVSGANLRVSVSCSPVLFCLTGLLRGVTNTTITSCNGKFVYLHVRLIRELPFVFGIAIAEVPHHNICTDFLFLILTGISPLFMTDSLAYLCIFVLLMSLTQMSCRLHKCCCKTLFIAWGSC